MCSASIENIWVDHVRIYINYYLFTTINKNSWKSSGLKKKITYDVGFDDISSVYEI